MLSFASILLLLLLLRRDMHSYFLIEVLLLLVQLTTSVLKQREIPSTVSSFYVSVLRTAMIRTSTSAVVLGCFFFCPLDCDASVMVVDCAAVETGCMLEKYIVFFSVSATTSFLRVYSVAVAAVFRRDMHFCFMVEVPLLLLVLVLLTTSVLKQREVPATVSSFYVSVFTLRCFGRLLLLLFLAASISVF